MLLAARGKADEAPFVCPHVFANCIATVRPNAETISATGQVYNLNALEDFPGKYTSHRKGITVGKGGFTALLESDRKVKIYLKGEATGMGSSMGMSSVTIKLK